MTTSTNRNLVSTRMSKVAAREFVCHLLNKDGVNENTVKVLAAFTAALLSETMNNDVIELSIGSAKQMAMEAGVPEAECNRVTASLIMFWRRKKAQNPLSCMF